MTDLLHTSAVATPAEQLTVQIDETLATQLRRASRGRAAGWALARLGDASAEEAQWVVVSVHPDEDAAREAASSGQLPVGFRYAVDPSPFMVAELDHEAYPDQLRVVEGDLHDLDEAEERRSEVSCPGHGDERCGRYSADGEGYDGLCGDCADRAYDEDEDEADQPDDDGYDELDLDPEIS